MSLIGHNSNSGEDWIKAYRSLRYHPTVGFLNQDGTRRSRRAVCETMAWVDLCMEAAWKDRKFDNLGREIIIERGQLIGSRKWLAARWGWTEDQVRYFLKKLEQEHMIELSSGKSAENCSEVIRGSFADFPGMQSASPQSRPQRRAHYANVLTICNYDIYQTARELEKLISPQSIPQSTHCNSPIIPQSSPNQSPQPKKREEREEREREISSSAFAQPDDLLTRSVEVNCVAINGPGFSLPFEAIDLTSSVLDLSPDKGRAAAEAQARAWAAQGLVPNNPIALLTAALRTFAADEEKKRKAADRLAKRQAKAVSEGAPEPKVEAHPLPGGEKWFLPQKWGKWAVENRGLEREQVLFIADGFKRYYTSEDCKRPKWKDWEKVWQGWIDRAIARGDLLKVRKTAADLVRPDDVPEPIWQEQLTAMVMGKKVSRQDAVAAGWMGA